MKHGMARPPLRVGGTPPAMRAESGRRACCSANSVSCAAVSTDTWQRRMGRNIAVSLRRWSDNKKRSPSVGRQGLLNRLHPRARNTRRRNYNRAGVMRGGMPYVRLHARRAAPTEPPSITLAKIFLQKPLRIGRRAGAAGGHSARARSPRRSQFPDSLAGFNPVVRADNAGAHVQPREQPRGVTRATRAPSSPVRSPARRRTRGSRASSRRCSHRRSARCGPCRRTRRRPESAAPHRRAIRSRRGSP